MNYKLARCCNPIYGDDVFGFISSDGVVKIHRSDCPNSAHIRERYPLPHHIHTLERKSRRTIRRHHLRNRNRRYRYSHQHHIHNQQRTRHPAPQHSYRLTRRQFPRPSRRRRKLHGKSRRSYTQNQDHKRCQACATQQIRPDYTSFVKLPRRPSYPCSPAATRMPMPQDAWWPQAQASLDRGDYDSAFIYLDSLSAAYPRQIEAGRRGLALRPRAIEGRTNQEIIELQCYLQAHQATADSADPAVYGHPAVRGCIRRLLHGQRRAEKLPRMQHRSSTTDPIRRILHHFITGRTHHANTPPYH